MGTSGLDVRGSALRSGGDYLISRVRVMPSAPDASAGSA
jgi:hypothetical protein